MNILGITDSITSGAAIVSDGVVLAAVSEERLNRHKMSMGFPLQSIGEVLRIAGLHPSELDGVAVATEHLFWRPKPLPFVDYFRAKKGGFRDLYLSMGAASPRSPGTRRLRGSPTTGLNRALTRTRPVKSRRSSAANSASRPRSHFSTIISVMQRRHISPVASRTHSSSRRTAPAMASALGSMRSRKASSSTFTVSTAMIRSVTTTRT